MTTQQQAQKIFNILVTELEYANDYNIFYVTRNLMGLSEEQLSITDNPQTQFLKSVKKNLTEGDVSDDFLRQVYAEAFRNGSIPKKRNHISMTCELEVGSISTPAFLSFWVDLDKVAAQLNGHLKINPPYRFELVKYDVHKTAFSNENLVAKTSSAVNSVQNTSSIITTNFLLGYISCVVSFYALLIAALAVASIISLSTAGIFTAVGVGLVAGGASYCFFKAIPGVTTTVAAIAELEHEKIEDILYLKEFNELGLS
jgi:hypothetical protein